jgi:putative lipoic acid-binding regulatory protein
MSDDAGAPGAPGGPGGEALLRYPVDYPLKAIGLAGDDLADHVRALVLGVAPGVVLGAAAVRPSSGGKYLAVTIVARLESEAQRRAIHAALQADARVLYQL